jgi:hypothetical protein
MVCMCEHIYKHFGIGNCPKCHKPTHDIDWAKEHEYAAKNKEKHGYFYNTEPGWWSI